MNALRLMLGTLTVLRVRPPTRVDTHVAGRAMTLAPLGGAVLALMVALPLALLLEINGLLVNSLVWATLVVGALALLTRGMHLDGLADTADGLGSGLPGDGALAVMKKSDIGPFGVVTLVLVMLLQVFLLAQLIQFGLGPVLLTVALVVSRWILPVLCSPAFLPARPDGLGHAVAGSVTGPLQVLAGALSAVLVGASVALGLAFGHVYVDQVLPILVVTPFAVVPGLLMTLRAVRRFGGVSGDVYGAAVEITFTAALLIPTIALASPM